MGEHLSPAGRCGKLGGIGVSSGGRKRCMFFSSAISTNGDQVNCVRTGDSIKLGQRGRMRSLPKILRDDVIHETRGKTKKGRLRTIHQKSEVN